MEKSIDGIERKNAFGSVSSSGSRSPPHVRNNNIINATTSTRRGTLVKHSPTGSHDFALCPRNAIGFDGLGDLLVIDYGIHLETVNSIIVHDII